MSIIIGHKRTQLRRKRMAGGGIKSPKLFQEGRRGERVCA